MEKSEDFEKDKKMKEKESSSSGDDDEAAANGGPSEEASEGGTTQQGEAEKLSRKFSYASVCSTETLDDGDDDDGDDDEEEHNKDLVLGPQVTLKEHFEMDKDDESLRRWKEQLLGGVDFSSVGENAEPEVKIQSLTIISPDRPDLVLPIPFVPNAKGYAFGLKDGSRYRLKFSFIVSNNIVSGLKYTNTVWKTGVRVDNTKVMLGTFSPQQEPYTYELEEETTPSGIFARGSYSARSKFVDDDGKCYLDVSYYFEIRKDWPAPS
ncbi:Rho GDP-dissociation inhibitor 1 [Acorus gramineus]|uniref:Rho GDP-dissociation inhibitor 1 n=1 Tax=Acorus gramineus TaxID=55184 RepID=A0AAV9A512_ACOGR|nr:Rho GDP-dissociation inhibitor 1 [Acorus gramineus]